MSVTVRFLGSGDAFASGGRGHACIHVSAQRSSLLLDCGASALPAITRSIDASRIDAVAVTHLHGDHFAGIPHLVMEQDAAGRSRPLVIGGPPGLAKRVALLGQALDPGFFSRVRPFAVRHVTLGPTPVPLGGAEVSAHPVRHSETAESHGLRVRVDGTLIAYSGDAAWSEELVALARGADLFICEATFFEREDPGHLSYRALMAHRAELDCERVVLTHLGAETLAHLGELELEYATDGMTLVV